MEDNKEAFNRTIRLAELYIGAEEFELAKIMLTKTVEMVSETFGQESFEKARAMKSLATCLSKNGEQLEAEIVLKEVRMKSN